ncbi:MAG: hypothetical protein ACJATA_000592 [Sphingobacteriales bacterium]|jgi:hypothetical protein
MKKVLFSTLALGLFSLAGFSQTVVNVTDADLNGGETYNWTKNNIYMLNGFVFLENAGILNIEAGTVIKGKETPTSGDNASALIITRGAKINAIGTSTEPVIFTAEIDDVTNATDLEATDRGLWGGLVILGYGNVAVTADTANIEGIPTTESRAVYGGSNDADNSGTLKYVSIRHGGAELAPGDEINGLTLGGVGSGTTFDYIEIIANSDDGIEFFGGAAQVTHLAVSYCGDDAVDYDLGYRGKGQFWFALLGSDDADNAGEHDGAKPDGETPYSNPTIYNATYIGSGVGAAAKNSTAIHFRDAAGGTYANSIFQGFANHALEVEDLPEAKGVDSRQRMEEGNLNLLNNLFFDFGAGDKFEVNATNGLLRSTPEAEDSTAQFLISHLTTNNNSIENPGLTAISRSNDGGLDPRPTAGSAAMKAGASIPTGDEFFTEVSYKGAFGDLLWLKGWTALDEYGHLSAVTGIAQRNNQVALQNYPNPFTGSTVIPFNLKSNDNVTVKVSDITGKVVAVLLENAPMSAGSHMVNFNNEVSAGTYIYSITTASGTVSGLMIAK